MTTGHFKEIREFFPKGKPANAPIRQFHNRPTFAIVKHRAAMKDACNTSHSRKT
jgi:hypothetical protein